MIKICHFQVSPSSHALTSPWPGGHSTGCCRRNQLAVGLTLLDFCPLIVIHHPNFLLLRTTTTGVTKCLQSVRICTAVVVIRIPRRGAALPITLPASIWTQLVSLMYLLHLLDQGQHLWWCLHCMASICCDSHHSKKADSKS